MKRSILALLACALAILLGMSLPAWAEGTVVDEAISALQTNPVFVAAGTEDTNSDTAGILSGQLKTGDNIVIVMLPASAVGSGGDLNTITQKINEGTGGNKIIGLSVGDQVLSYSLLLPAGVAPDLMDRAKSVSTNTSETLGTFIRNAHDWQRRNPTAVASQDPHKSSSTPLPLIGGAGLAVLGIGAGVAFIISRRMRLQKEGVYFKFRSPEPVRDNLERIWELRDRINNVQMSEIITQMCRDTEALFKRQSSRDSDITSDFQHHLASVVAVLEQYIDIQDNPRYYENSYQELTSGEEAIDAFSQYVLRVIQNGGRSGLTQFHVDKKILSAQKYA